MKAHRNMCIGLTLAVAWTALSPAARAEDVQDYVRRHSRLFNRNVAPLTFEVGDRLQMPGDWTLEFWFDPGWVEIGASGKACIVTRTTGDATQWEISLVKDDVKGGFNLAVWDGGEEGKADFDQRLLNDKIAWPLGALGVEDNQFHHVALVFRASGTVVYYDGQRRGVLSGTVIRDTSSGTLTIGSKHGGDFFDGWMGGFRFWSKAIDEDSLRQFASPGKDGVLQGLLRHPDFAPAPKTRSTTDGRTLGGNLIAYTEFTDESDLVNPPRANLRFPHPLLGFWVDRDCGIKPTVETYGEPNAYGQAPQRTGWDDYKTYYVVQAGPEFHFYENDTFLGRLDPDTLRLTLVDELGRKGSQMQLEVRLEAQQIGGVNRDVAQLVAHIPAGGSLGSKKAGPRPTELVMQRMADVERTGMKAKPQLEAFFTGVVKDEGDSFGDPVKHTASVLGVYDITALDPWLLNPTGVEGRTVFADESNNAIRDGNLGLDVPPNLDVYWLAEGSAEFTSNFYSSMTDVMNGWKLSAGMEIGCPVFSISVNAKKDEELRKIATGEKTLVTREEMMRYYLAVVNPQRAELSDGFYNAVVGLERDMGTDKFPEKMKTFIENWGTHYCAGAVLGAKAVFTQAIDRSEYEERIKKSWEIEVKAEGQAKKISGGANVGYGEQTEDAFKDIFENDEWTCRAKGAAAPSLDEPLQADPDDVAAIELDLRPLDELLSPRYFASPAIYASLRPVLRRALLEYIRRRSESASEYGPSALPLVMLEVDPMDFEIQALKGQCRGLDSSVEKLMFRLGSERVDIHDFRNPPIGKAVDIDGDSRVALVRPGEQARYAFWPVIKCTPGALGVSNKCIGGSIDGRQDNPKGFIMSGGGGSVPDIYYKLDEVDFSRLLKETPRNEWQKGHISVTVDEKKGEFQGDDGGPGIGRAYVSRAADAQYKLTYRFQWRWGKDRNLTSVKLGDEYYGSFDELINKPQVFPTVDAAAGGLNHAPCAYWPFDGHAVDYVGGRRSLVNWKSGSLVAPQFEDDALLLTPDLLLEDRTAKPNGTVEYRVPDAAEQHLMLGERPPETNAFTIHFDFKTTDDDSLLLVADDAPMFAFYVQDRRLMFASSIAGVNYTLTPRVIDPNRWHKLIAVFTEEHVEHFYAADLVERGLAPRSKGGHRLLRVTVDGQTMPPVEAEPSDLLCRLPPRWRFAGSGGIQMVPMAGRDRTPRCANCLIDELLVFPEALTEEETQVLARRPRQLGGRSAPEGWVRLPIDEAPIPLPDANAESAGARVHSLPDAAKRRLIGYFPLDLDLRDYSGRQASQDSMEFAQGELQADPFVDRAVNLDGQEVRVLASYMDPHRVTVHLDFALEGFPCRLLQLGHAQERLDVDGWLWVDADKDGQLWLFAPGIFGNARLPIRGGRIHDNDWHKLILSVDMAQREARIFLDGEIRYSGPIGDEMFESVLYDRANSRNLWLGRRYVSVAPQGRVDELMVFADALDTRTISDLGEWVRDGGQPEGVPLATKYPLRSWGKDGYPGNARFVQFEDFHFADPAKEHGICFANSDETPAFDRTRLMVKLRHVRGYEPKLNVDELSADDVAWLKEATGVDLAETEVVSPPAEGVNVLWWCPGSSLHKTTSKIRAPSIRGRLVAIVSPDQNGRRLLFQISDDVDEDGRLMADVESELSADAYEARVRSSLATFVAKSTVRFLADDLKEALDGEDKLLLTDTAEQLLKAADQADLEPLVQLAAALKAAAQAGDWDGAAKAAKAVTDKVEYYKLRSKGPIFRGQLG